MQQLVILIHILVALALIALVLLQQGKGATMGAAFGSGASNTLFGSRGPASFLMKLTGTLVAIFFITSLSLGYLAARQARESNVLMAPPVPVSLPVESQPAPAQPAPAVSQAPAAVTVS